MPKNDDEKKEVFDVKIDDESDFFEAEHASNDYPEYPLPYRLTEEGSRVNFMFHDISITVTAHTSASGHPVDIAVREDGLIVETVVVRDGEKPNPYTTSDEIIDFINNIKKPDDE